MAIHVKRFLTSVNDANCYICWCEHTKEGLIIDPAEFSNEMKATISDNELKIVGVLITHGHYDHNGALEEVLTTHAVPVYAGYKKPDVELVQSGDTLEFGDEMIAVAATPGHTVDSVTFYGETFAFVGDALFAGAVGGTTRREDFETEIASIWENIFSMPDCTILYPGHGPATTVGLEKCYNPFFI